MKLFEIFAKKEKKQEVESNNSSGFFSTDINIHSSAAKRAQWLTNMLSISFQKGIEDIKPLAIQSDGSYAFDSNSSHAMDSACGEGVVSSRMMANRSIGMPDAQYGWYASQGFIGWQTAALLSQHWLIDKACTMPARDACRHGYEITVNEKEGVSPEVLAAIRDYDKKFKIIRNCQEFIRNGRIFGIRIAMFVVDSPDPKYYEYPFNPDAITPGSYKGISQVDPYWCAPMLDGDAASNPASKHFYEPTWWVINGQKVHRTHLVIMRNGDVPDILKPTYFYGGIPVPQKIAERVYAAERTSNEAPMLAISKRLTALKMDLTQAIPDMQTFTAKMEMWTQLQNNFGIKVIGTDEEINQFDTSLADLDAVIMTQYQIVAAGAEVPATKLMGTTPKGFNSTGEHETLSYHEMLESLQEHELTDLVERHHVCLIRSYIAPKFGIKPFVTDINWNPVDSPTAAQIAEINLKRAQTDSTLAGTGAIDGVDIRNRLIEDKESGYNGLKPIEEPMGQEEVIQDEETNIA